MRHPRDFVRNWCQLVRLADVRAVLVLVVAAGCNLADKLVLWPPGAESANGARRELVTTSEGTLEVFTARNQPVEPAAFVLRFYGNADLANRWVASEAENLDAGPIEIWGVNYLGYGGSTGDATLENVALSARAAYAALAGRAHGRPIIVIGTSLGTAAALHVAAREPVAGLVLVNPPPLRQLVRSHGWWNLWLIALPVSWQVTNELDSIANARRSTAPAIFISSREDSVVPTDYQQQVIDAYAGPLRVLDNPGADHNDAVPAQIQLAITRAIAGWISTERALR